MVKKKRWIKRVKYSLLLGMLLVFLLQGKLVAASVFPKPSEAVFVYDETNELSRETKNYIVAINKEYEQTAENPQLAVALVTSLGDLTVDEYAVGLFDKWKIGDSALSNGSLLLLAPSEGKVRIEVGYGLEDILTDAKTGWILDNNLQLLQQKNFDQGVYQIVTEMALQINQAFDYKSQVVTGKIPDYDELINQESSEADENDSSTIIFDILQFIGIVIIVLILRMLGFSGRGGGGGFGGYSGRSSGGGSSFGGGSSGGGGSSRSF